MIILCYRLQIRSLQGLIQSLTESAKYQTEAQSLIFFFLFALTFYFINPRLSKSLNDINNNSLWYVLFDKRIYTIIYIK